MNHKMNIPKNALVILVGVAGSGKSTLAQKAFGKDAVIVSSDECRKKLTGKEDDQTVNKEAFELFYAEIENGVKNGKQVIADATNLSKISRERLYEIANKYTIPVYALVFNIPLDVIKKQNSGRDRIVPEPVIEKMFHQMSNVYKEIENELPKDHIIDIVRSVSKQEEQDR